MTTTPSAPAEGATITITLSRADAEQLREALGWAIAPMLTVNKIALLNDVARIDDALDAALAAAPRPAEGANTVLVTLTMDHLDAESLRDAMGENGMYLWDDDGHAYRVTPGMVQAFDAALSAAAPRPAEEADTLDAAVKECEARGWEVVFLAPDDSGDSFCRLGLGGLRVGSAYGATPLAALRAAMAEAEGSKG